MLDRKVAAASRYRAWARDHRAQGMKRGVSRVLIHQAPQRLFDLCGFACGELVFDDHMEQHEAPIGHGGWPALQRDGDPSITASRSLSSTQAQPGSPGRETQSFCPSRCINRIRVALRTLLKSTASPPGMTSVLPLDLASSCFYDRRRPGSLWPAVASSH